MIVIILLLDYDDMPPISVSKWEIIDPLVRNITLPLSAYICDNMEGDGNCLTRCVRHILQKQCTTFDATIRDLKLVMTLHVFVRLVKGSSLIDFLDNGLIPSSADGLKSSYADVMERFLKRYGDSEVKDDWARILRELEAPDEIRKKNKKGLSEFEEILKRINKSRPKLKDLYTAFFHDCILKDKYYLPSESLRYFCEAFSINISLWYADQFNPGSYFKMEEYGINHKATFMIRMVQFELDIQEKRLKSGSLISWNFTKEVTSITHPHFDVLFLTESGFFELKDAKDVLLCTAKLSPSYELVRIHESSSSSSSSLVAKENSLPERNRLKLGEITFEIIFIQML
jgi:hypothetical protein